MNDWSKMHDVPTPDSAGVSMPCQIQSSLIAQNDKEELHKHNIRIVNGMNYAIRWCTVPGCMQSWRLPVRMDGIDEPIAEWEPISEPVDLLSPILPDYDD